MEKEKTGGESSAFTVYNERGLHRALKRRFCPDEDGHEVKIGKYVADALRGNEIIEIQTGSLSPLAKKLEFYLNETEHEVLVVHPVARDRRLIWIDEETGEAKPSSRLSPKHGSVADGIADLLYVGELIGRERLSFCIILMEIDELRALDGYGKAKKIRATSLDRLAGEVYEEIYIRSVDDIAALILPLLPEGEFGREDLARSLGLGGRRLWAMQALLTQTEILSSRRDGRRIFFSARGKIDNKG